MLKKLFVCIKYILWCLRWCCERDLFSMPFRQLLSKISNTRLNEKTVVIVTAILIFSMIMDMELSNLADMLQKRIGSSIGIFTFVVISGVYLSVQYLLLRYSKQITADLRSRKKDVNFIESIVSILQIFIITIFLLIVAEIALTNTYDILLLIIITLISNGLTVMIMLFLFKRLLGYYKSHPQSAILSYAISSFIISVTAFVTIVFMVPVLALYPEFISSTMEVGFPTFIPGSVLDVLNYAYYILSIISFLSVWVGTVALLVHYLKKVGMAKFWIAMILPLAFYVGQIAVIAFQIPVPFIKLDPVSFIFYYRVVFTVSSTIGGILFSMPFFLVSKLIPHESNMRRHLIILGVGMVLFFVSGSATVYHSPFPPFGLATVALIGTSSYMLFLGLYSCVISLSEDSELYKLIRKSAKEWKFFLKLSDAEVEKSVLDKVENVKKVMTAESGIMPSVSITDAKNYLTAVLDQLKREYG